MGERGDGLAGGTVTRRRDIERNLAGLQEIRAILDAMRNLAVLETRKIARFREAHRRSLDTLAAAASDVARFHAPALRGAPRTTVWILIGSERGFCGDLNETLLAAWQKRGQSNFPVTRHAADALVVVGGRLAARLPAGERVQALAGPSIAEDVNEVIVHLAEALRALLQRETAAALDLEVLHHEPDSAAPQLARLEPFPEPPPGGAGTPPQLDLPPAALLPELGERHLLAQLQALLYAALAAENEQRLRHMEAAIRHIDEDSERLTVQRNRLRQEEITEEIEVLMLSAERLRGPAERG
jgi:F-type H+-transporting ATPase subunit gamma